MYSIQQEHRTSRTMRLIQVVYPTIATILLNALDRRCSGTQRDFKFYRPLVYSHHLSTLSKPRPTGMALGYVGRWLQGVCRGGDSSRMKQIQLSAEGVGSEDYHVGRVGHILRCLWGGGWGGRVSTGHGTYWWVTSSWIGLNWIGRNGGLQRLWAYQNQKW